MKNTLTKYAAMLCLIFSTALPACKTITADQRAVYVRSGASLATSAFLGSQKTPEAMAEKIYNAALVLKASTSPTTVANTVTIITAIAPGTEKLTAKLALYIGDTQALAAGMMEGTASFYTPPAAESDLALK